MPTPAGWHADPDGRYSERYWNGETWTLRIRDEGLEKIDPHRAGPTLQAQVQSYVSQGWRIESQSATQAAILRGERPNHVLHLLLSACTFGLWGIFVWLPIILFGGTKRRVLTIDELGQITVA